MIDIKMIDITIIESFLSTNCFVLTVLIHKKEWLFLNITSYINQGESGSAREDVAVEA